jgi:hypothetical protein
VSSNGGNYGINTSRGEYDVVTTDRSSNFLFADDNNLYSQAGADNVTRLRDDEAVRDIHRILLKTADGIALRDARMSQVRTKQQTSWDAIKRRYEKQFTRPGRTSHKYKNHQPRTRNSPSDRHSGGKKKGSNSKDPTYKGNKAKKKRGFTMKIGGVRYSFKWKKW